MPDKVGEVQRALVRQLVAWLTSCAEDAEERAAICRRASRVSGTIWHQVVNAMADAHDSAGQVYRDHLRLVDEMEDGVLIDVLENRVH